MPFTAKLLGLHNWLILIRETEVLSNFFCNWRSLKEVLSDKCWLTTVGHI